MPTTTLLAALCLCLGLLATLAGCGDGHDRRADGTVTVANLNVLHGFDCDAGGRDTRQCRVDERIALLADHLVDAGCPDIVTLQEVVNRDFAPTALAQPLQSIVELLQSELPRLAADCGFTYRLLYMPLRAVTIDEADEELILSRYPVIQSAKRNLFGPLYNEAKGILVFARHVLHARVDHPAGAIDIYTTHLASGSDLGGSPCGADCPAICDRDGTVRACQAEQLARFVEQTRDPQAPALITGDFNAQPGSAEYRVMTGRGWLDSHIVAGAPECNPATGAGCTSGRDSTLEAINDRQRSTRRRIDYIFVALPQGAGSCAVVGAGLFAADPNPFAADCGSAPLAPCWVSDHSGNRVELACRE